MKSISFRAQGCALVVACGAAFPVAAQLALKDVVVTANRVATQAADVLSDVTVIDRAVLDQAGQSTLRDVLGQQAGVQMVSNGGYRSITGLFLRGAASSQTVVLIDGVRIGSATAGTVALENIPLERIERIEILRGAASALYGPDAVGGVVHIFTRGPVDGFNLNVQAGLGTDGQQQAGFALRGRTGDWGYSLGVSREQATGISVIQDALASSYNPDADGFESTSVDAKVSLRITPQHTASVTLLQSKSDAQFDGTPFPNPLGLTRLTSDAHAKPETVNLTAQWVAQWRDDWRSTVTAGRSDDVAVSDYYRIPDGAFGGTGKFNTGRGQLTWQNDITWGQDTVTVLLEKRAETIDSSTAFTVKDREVQSALVSYALNRGAWNALLVARSDDNSQFGRFNNWAASGGYRFTPAWQLVSSLGTSFQAPTFNQLYFPSFGNPALLPQLNRSMEVGVKYRGDNANFQAVTYQNNIEGFIVPSTNAQSSRAVLQGLTVSGALTRGDTRVSMSYDYTDPRSYSSVAAANDLRLLRVAKHLINARVTQDLGDVSAFAEVKLSTDREDSKVNFAPGRDTLAGYGVLNVGASWKANKELTVLARLNNATDQVYQLANTFSMPGRNLFVSASWSL